MWRTRRKILIFTDSASVARFSVTELLIFKASAAVGKELFLGLRTVGQNQLV